jgi:uncharacterized membrane protein
VFQVHKLTLLGGTRKVIYIANHFKVVEDTIKRIPLKQKFWDSFCVVLVSAETNKSSSYNFTRCHSAAYSDNFTRYHFSAQSTV